MCGRQFRTHALCSRSLERRDFLTKTWPISVWKHSRFHSATTMSNTSERKLARREMKSRSQNMHADSTIRKLSLRSERRQRKRRRKVIPMASHSDSATSELTALPLLCQSRRCQSLQRRLQSANARRASDTHRLPVAKSRPRTGWT